MKPCRHCHAALDNNVVTCPECGRLTDGSPAAQPGSRGRRPLGIFFDDVSFGVWLLFSFLVVGPIGYVIGGWPGFAIGAALAFLLPFAVAGGD